MTPRNIDAFGRWFTEFEKQNECSDIAVGLVSPGNSDCEFRTYSHALYDGVSIFKEILQEQGVSCIPDHAPAALIRRSAPPLYRQLASYLCYLVSVPFHNGGRQWRVKEAVWPTVPLQVAEGDVVWRVLDAEQTGVVLSNARYKGVKLTAFAISHFLPALEPLWQPHSKDKILIGLPLSLHRDYASVSGPANRFSLLDIRVDDTSTAQVIEQLIHVARESVWHYGLLIGFHSPRFIGHWFYGFFLRYIAHCQRRSIIFSSMGRWHNSAHNSLWFVPPVQHFSPMSVGMITWGGRLSLAIRAHPSTNINRSQLNRICNQWIESMVDEAGQNS